MLLTTFKNSKMHQIKILLINILVIQKETKIKAVL